MNRKNTKFIIKEILKKTACILADIFFAALMLIGISFVLLKLFGVGVYAIKTASMSESYPVGTVVLVSPEEPENIAIGDVISFVADESLTVVTHRVVDIDSEAGCFYTKGDSNNVSDGSAVKYENYLGKVVFAIPYLGYIVLFAQGTVGRIIIFTLIAMIVIFYIVCLVLKIIKRKRAVSYDKKT